MTTETKKLKPGTSLCHKTVAKSLVRLGLCEYTTQFKAYSPTDGRMLRDATAGEIAAYTAANKLRAERCPVRRARCFDEAIKVGDVRIDTHTGPGAWFGGAGF